MPRSMQIDRLCRRREQLTRKDAMMDEFVCSQFAVFIHIHNHLWNICYNFYLNTYPIASIYYSVLLLR